MTKRQSNHNMVSVKTPAAATQRLLIIVAGLLASATASADVAQAQDPGWNVNPAAFQFSMNVTSAVYVDGVRSTDVGHVAAFVGEELRGVAEPTLVSGQPVFFLTVYANANAESISFRAYDGVADSVLEGTQQLSFLSNGIVGTPSAPYRLDFGVDPSVDDPATWTIDPANFGLTMTATVRVGIGGKELVDPDAVMAAFVGSDVRGTAPATAIGGKSSATTLFFLTVYANVEEELVTLRVSSPDQDTVYTFVDAFAFSANAALGGPSSPLMIGSAIHASNDKVAHDEAFSLDVFPNPASSVVQIQYDVPVGMPVTVKAYDVIGRLVADISSVRDATGPRMIVWPTLTQAGIRLEPGLYFLRLVGGGQTFTRALTVIR